MEVVRYVFQAIESDWRLLVLFTLVLAHTQAFAAIGILYPRRIRQPTPTYWCNIHLFGKLVFGGFEWVGFKYFTRSLPSGNQANYYLLGFYYLILINKHGRSI